MNEISSVNIPPKANKVDFRASAKAHIMFTETLDRLKLMRLMVKHVSQWSTSDACLSMYIRFKSMAVFKLKSRKLV